VEFVQLIEQLATQQLLAHQPDFIDAVKKYPDKAGSFSISEFNCLAGLFPMLVLPGNFIRRYQYL
jgi:hypothetical protein